MGLLEVSLVGVSYATSRWTLTTTLFRAIKRINLSRGSRTCFYIYKRRLAIFTHFKTLDITRVSRVIYFLCLFYYCFYLLFSEDLTVVRIKQNIVSHRARTQEQWYFFFSWVSLYLCDLVISFDVFSLQSFC